MSTVMCIHQYPTDTSVLFLPPEQGETQLVIDGIGEKVLRGDWVAVYPVTKSQADLIRRGCYPICEDVDLLNRPFTWFRFTGKVTVN